MPRMPAILTLCIVLLFQQPVFAISPFHIWSAGYGDTGQQSGYGVIIDGTGNVIITGAFASSINFGGSTLTSAGAVDAFLAKFDANGNHIWSAGYGTATFDQYGTSVAVDASGNIVMAGYFLNSINLGGGVLTAVGGVDIFVAKFSPAGAHIWSKRFGSITNDLPERVAVDAGQNVVLSGSFTSTIDFGGPSLTSAGGSDAFLAKLDAAGNHVWSKKFGDVNTQGQPTVAVDASSNIVLAGGLGGSIDFGGGVLTNPNPAVPDIYVARFDAGGNHLWSKRFGDTAIQSVHAVAVDKDGNVIVGGTFNSTVDFGGGLLTSAGVEDFYLAKFSSGGIHQWSARYGDVNANSGTIRVGTDSYGYVIAVGGFSNSVNFGLGALVTAGDLDVFHARFTPGGVCVASDRSGDTGAGQFARQIAIGPDGSVALVGDNTGALDFGGGPLPAPGGSGNVFLAKFQSAKPNIASITDVGNDQGRSLRLTLARSGFDAAGVGAPIVSYVAFRRIDPTAAGVVRPELDAAPGDPLLTGWEFAASIPAFAEDEYTMIVPTLADSTVAAGQHYSVFFIRAATATPSAFFDSPIDSGYSLDNLAPGVPTNLVFSAGLLSWHDSPAADFDYFTVYGSNTNAIGSATVIGYTVSSLLDVTSSPYVYYFVTATDFSGNESAPGTLSTATDVGDAPRSYVLSVSNFPNPFNPSTTVSYTVPSRGVVTVSIYDTHGALVATLVNHESRDAGGYRTEWNGRGSNGEGVSSGIYFARIEHNGNVRSKKMVLLK